MLVGVCVGSKVAVGADVDVIIADGLNVKSEANVVPYVGLYVEELIVRIAAVGFAVGLAVFGIDVVGDEVVGDDVVGVNVVGIDIGSYVGGLNV